jgi:hypothetical protein
MTILERFNPASITTRTVYAGISHWWRPVDLNELMLAEGGILTTCIWRQNSQSLLAGCEDIANNLAHKSTDEPSGLILRHVMFLLVAAVVLAGLSLTASPQSVLGSGDSSSVLVDAPSSHLDLAYVRPTQRTMARNYVFDAYGPYPIAGAALTAGIDQLGNSPSEWNQGVEGYSKRFGSNLGIAAVGTTTRYGLSEAFSEDTLYYRCECRGVFPRMSHALISVFTARRGEDGHRVFSFPALVAPYAGSMTAVYGWYPNRYNAKDAFRIGNYSLLAYAGENISLEFFYSGPHSLLHRMHLNNTHGSPIEGPNK